MNLECLKEIVCPHSRLNEKEQMLVLEGRMGSDPLFPFHKNEILCARFSPNGNLLGVGCSDGTLRIINVEDNEMYGIELNRVIVNEEGPVVSLRWNENKNSRFQDTIFVVCSTDEVMLCHISTGRVIWRYVNVKMLSDPSPEEFICCDFSDDFSLMACAGKLRQILVFSGDDHRLLKRLYCPPEDPSGCAVHAGRILSLQFLKRPRRTKVKESLTSLQQYLLVSIDDRGAGVTWDLSSGAVISQFFGSYPLRESVAELRSKDGNPLIAVTSFRRSQQLHVRDPLSGQFVGCIPLDEGNIQINNHSDRSEDPTQSMLQCIRSVGPLLICLGSSPAVVVFVSPVENSLIDVKEAMQDGVVKTLSPAFVILGSELSGYFLHCVDIWMPPSLKKETRLEAKILNETKIVIGTSKGISIMRASPFSKPSIASTTTTLKKLSVAKPSETRLSHAVDSNSLSDLVF